MRSLLDGASVGGTLTILPARALAMNIEKQVYPFPNSKPFTVLVKSTIPYNVNNFMPNVTASVLRQFGSRKFGTLSYSTGSQLTWPSFVKGILSPFMNTSLDPRLEPLLVNDGSLQLQYTSLSSPAAAEVADDLSLSKSTENEVWQWGLAATPAGGQLSLNYGRTFFADNLEDVPRSEWNLDGYHPAIPIPDRRGVRVEVEAAIDLDGDMAWGVTASRRVGEFTNMGLGVSLRDARGLVLALSWRRLGQSIRVPILVCPFDLADAEISAIAVIVPWLTYIGVEFGYIRPQERRRRREAIIRKRKLLKSQISARKKESAQQIELMSDLTKRRQAREKDKGGLVVEKAEYGYLPPKNAKRAESEVIDVTIPMAAQVEKSQLFISKNTIRVSLYIPLRTRRPCMANRTARQVSNNRFLRPGSSITQNIKGVVYLPRAASLRRSQRWRRPGMSAKRTYAHPRRFIKEHSLLRKRA
jgi:DnaJ family protein C protein 11